VFEDRSYQADSVNYALDHGPDVRPIHCAPTGSGKTVIQALIAQRELQRGNRTAILTPREEIFGQTHGVLEDMVGWSNVALLKSGEEWRSDKPVHVVSWPTLTTRVRKSDAWYPDVDRVIVDEAHLAMAPKILEALQYYAKRNVTIDGFTATPARKSGKGLGRFFTTIKHVTSVRQLIADGKLAPLEYWAGSYADVTKVRTTAGDFNTKDLGKASEPLIGDVVDNWFRLARTRHTIVFAVDVAHCEALTDRFLQAGIKAASIHVHKTPERRAEIVRQFKAGEVQVLVNVTIASYGFDAPTIDCIVMARPTKSIVLHLQMLGRGMRVAEGKESCMVLDHADNVRRLGQADDLFRWRLDKGKEASANWTRDQRSEDAKKGDDKVRECESCHYLFSRSRICPKCGTEIPMPKREVATIDADLVRISKQRNDPLGQGWPDNQAFYLMLKWIAVQKGYRDGWVFHKYIERVGLNPEKGWRLMAPLPANERVENWVRSRQIAWAKSKRRATG